MGIDMDCNLRVWDTRMQRFRSRSVDDPPALMLHHQRYPNGITWEAFQAISFGRWDCDATLAANFVPHHLGFGRHTMGNKHHAPLCMPHWQENNMPGVDNFDLGIYGNNHDIYLGRGPRADNRVMLAGRLTFGQVGNELPLPICVS